MRVAPDIHVHTTCDRIVSAVDPDVANLSFNVLMQVDASKSKRPAEAVEKLGGTTIPTLFTIRCWLRTNECEGSQMRFGNVVAGHDISDVDLLPLQGMQLAERNAERVIISDKKKERVFIVNRIERKVAYSYKFPGITDESSKADCDNSPD